MPKLYKSFSEKSTSTIPQKKKSLGLKQFHHGPRPHLPHFGVKPQNFWKRCVRFFFGDVVRVKENESYATTETSSCAQGATENASEIAKIIGEYWDVWSILIGFSIRNHPFWGIPIFGTTHMGVRRPKASAEKTTVKTWVFLAVDDQKQLNFWSSFLEFQKTPLLPRFFFKLNKVQVKKSTFGGFCG